MIRIISMLKGLLPVGIDTPLLTAKLESEYPVYNEGYEQESDSENRKDYGKDTYTKIKFEDNQVVKSGNSRPKG